MGSLSLWRTQPSLPILSWETRPWEHSQEEPELQEGRKTEFWALPTVSLSVRQNVSHGTFRPCLKAKAILRATETDPVQARTSEKLPHTTLLSKPSHHSRVSLKCGCRIG